MWLLFVPLVILVVLVLSGMALVGALVGLLSLGWPWLLIAAGVWLFWHEDGPRRRYGKHARRAWGGPRPISSAASARQAQPAATAPTSAAAAARPAAPPQPELPIDVQVKVEQIRRKVEVLLGYADRFPPFSQDLFLVRQTASEYLPRTIEAFLRLPEPSRTAALGGADGRTPLQELTTQLDLLDAKLDEIARDLQRQDLDRLLANRRFLEERFGGRASA
jgi:hypothetical protein